MIGATRRWLRRNRNGIAIGVGVVGAAYLAGQYVVNKISEARERSQLDQRAKENLRRRFEQNQRDCTFTVLALLPTLTENVVESLPVEQLTNELQQKKAERLARLGQEGTPSELSGMTSTTEGGEAASQSSSSYIHASQMGESAAQSEGSGQPRRSKAQLWNELKISSITRVLTLLYTISLLAILTRIQLNLLGRRNYLSSVVSMASPSASYSGKISLQNNEDGGEANTYGNDFDTNRKYLTFSWWLLNRGYQDIIARVRAAVEEVFGPIPPTEALTPARLSSLILQVRQKIEGSTEGERQAMRWLPYLLPPQQEESTVLVESGVITPPSHSSPTSPPSSAQLRRLLDETADLIDSPHFNRINTLLLNSLFTHLIDVQVLTQAFPSMPPSPSHPQRLDPSSSVTIVPSPPSQPSTKLANILAVLTRQAHTIGSSTTIPIVPSSTISSGLSMTNEYVESMTSEVKELESFAAVIYAGNLQEEGEAIANTLGETAPTASSENLMEEGISERELREGLGLLGTKGLGESETAATQQGGFGRAWDRAWGLATG